MCKLLLDQLTFAYLRIYMYMYNWESNKGGYGIYMYMYVCVHKIVIKCKLTGREEQILA